MLPRGNRNTQEPKLYGMHTSLFYFFTGLTLYHGICAALNFFFEKGGYVQINN